MDQRLAVGLKRLIIFMLYSCVLSSFLSVLGVFAPEQWQRQVNSEVSMLATVM